jgi:hypothetical protein
MIYVKLMILTLIDGLGVLTLHLFFVLSEIINYYFVLDIGFRGLDSYYCLTSTVIFLDEPSLSTLFKRYIYIYINTLDS